MSRACTGIAGRHSRRANAWRRLRPVSAMDCRGAARLAMTSVVNRRSAAPPLSLRGGEADEAIHGGQPRGSPMARFPALAARTEETR
jgi:hypothetical protein